MDSVENKGLIGKGAFGCVYLVENKAKEQFAVKVMSWQFAPQSEREVAENELKVLKELSHEHVLEYLDSFHDSGQLYIITEYCSGGDMSAFLDHTGQPVPEDLLRVWLWQIACGLEYMHKHEKGPVLHRDLKPSNIYLSENGDIRLGDMGIARILDRPDAMAETFCGTPPYMSPEALQEKPYNSKTDIWSLGCCVVEMATLERAYEGSSLAILRNAVLKRRQPLPKEYSGELDRLLSNMLLLNYEDRISASDILDDMVLEGCEHAEPMPLIEKHKLEVALAMHRRTSPSSTMTKDRDGDAGALTLAASLSNIQAILDDGGPQLTTYRIKVDNRMCGRRPDDDTVIHSDNIKTVIYKPGAAAKPKTMKKQLKLPTVTSSKPDDSLSRPVLSSMLTVVGNIATKGTAWTASDAKTKCKRDQEAATSVDEKSKERLFGQTFAPVLFPSSNSAGGEPSRSSQMRQLREITGQIFGQASLQSARSIVQSTLSNADMQSRLTSLFGEQLLLNNIIVYLLLMESAAQSHSDS